MALKLTITNEKCVIPTHKAKAKVKALTTSERLDRIEELLGLK